MARDLKSHWGSLSRKGSVKSKAKFDHSDGQSFGTFRYVFLCRNMCLELLLCEGWDGLTMDYDYALTEHNLTTSS